MICNWCKGPQDIYISYYQNDRTEGEWRRGATIYSCKNEKCPYHRHFIDGEIKEYPSETVRIERISAFYQPSDNPLVEPLDKPVSDDINLTNSETIVS